MNKIKLLVGTTLTTLACSSWAYEAGDIIVRAGVANVSPDASSSELLLDGGAIVGSSANVHGNTQLGLTGVYMLTSDIGIEVLASTPFEHDITADTGALGLGRVGAGSTKHLPPTVSVQYYPAAADSRWQPYAGIGLNYTIFFSENVSNTLEGVLGAGTLDLDSSLGLAVQAGVDYQLSDNLLLNLGIWHVDIDTTANYDFNGTSLVTDVSIDPTVYSFSVGYKF